MTTYPLPLTLARIDTDALRHNTRRLRARTPGLDLIGVVKADAYGHGMTIIAPVLAEEGVTTLAVATPREGMDLRSSGHAGRIIVFAPPSIDQLPLYTEFDMEVVVGSKDTLDQVSGSGSRLACHVEIDTGMGRLGTRPEHAAELIHTVESTPGLRLEGIFTHFARADEPESDFTEIQLERFRNVMTNLGSAPAPVHLAGSAAVYTSVNALDPTFASSARVGIALYGLVDLAEAVAELNPVMTFESRLTAVQHSPKGCTVSYGSRWIAPRDTRLGIVGAGYADGYPRSISEEAFVSVNGRACPVVGTVCMDMLMVDLGQVPAEVNERVVLFGGGGPSCLQLSAWADTIPYVTVCAISGRVPRVSE